MDKADSPPNGGTASTPRDGSAGEVAEWPTTLLAGTAAGKRKGNGGRGGSLPPHLQHHALELRQGNLPVLVPADGEGAVGLRGWGWGAS